MEIDDDNNAHHGGDGGTGGVPEGGGGQVVPGGGGAGVARLTMSAPVSRFFKLKTSGKASNHFVALPNEFAKWLLAWASTA